MAFTVDWELDASEGVNVESLPGDISVTDGHNRLVETSVYQDSWIKALAEASRLAAQGATTFDVEIIEESRPIQSSVAKETGSAESALLAFQNLTVFERTYWALAIEMKLC